MGGGEVILTIGGIILAAVLGAVLLGFGIYFFIRIMQVLGRVLVHVFTTIGAWIGDVFRLVGAVIVALVFIPLTVLNVAIGRWSASAHYGRAFTGECKTAGACFYRIVLGHPLRLIGLGGLTEGIEQRLPQAMADAPGSDKPSRRQGMFEGYRIVGSLPGGGSGGKLYIAEPDELKRAAFDRRGFATIDRVVIKTFSLTDGSSLPQIVRESRALDAAKKMGLVLEHELTDERFYYVMRYVPGDSLTVVTQRMHANAPAAGLDNRGVKHAIGYATDLLEGLDVYHRGGLWHKDVKPDNLIVDREQEAELGRGRAHLVDFGLITPLRSAMTLTTHGTEYFRDPELVRQALKGVKVHQIDGAKFDVYAAGAVLYSMIENSFPAHGGLSQVSKRCPEGLRWIIRRAMTDYDKRYASAREMLDDLAVLATAADPFAVKPADLPSVRGGPIAQQPAPEPMPEPMPAATPAAPEPVAASPVPPATPADAAPRDRSLPRLRLSNWWSGRYEVDESRRAPRNASGFVYAADIGVGPRRAEARHAPRPQARPARTLTPVDSRLSAAEQLANARQRVADRRAAAQRRKHRRGPDRFSPAAGPSTRAGRPRRRHQPAGVNAGVVIASLFVVGAITGAVLVPMLTLSGRSVEIRETAGSEAIGHVREARGAIAPAAPTPPVADPHDGLADHHAADVRADLLALVPSTGRELEACGVAVLVDFRPPFDKELDKDLDLFDRILADHGVSLASNLIVEYADKIEGGDDIIAELKTLRGFRTLGEPLGEDLNAVVAATPGLDAVWWVGPAEDSTQRRFLLATDDAVSAFTSTDITLTDVTTAFVAQHEH